MAVLVLRDESGAAFSCGVEGWLQSPEEKQQWQNLVTQLVQYAFESRPATLITVAPMQWSIGHSLPEPHQLRTNQGEFLVNRVERSSGILLAEIAESEDFQRGLLWLLALDATDEDQLLSVITQLDVLSPAPTTSDVEVLLLLDDARCIYWLHPSRDVNTLATELLVMTQRFGWRLSKESRTTSSANAESADMRPRQGKL